MTKRSQLSVFIIIGLIVLILAGFLMTKRSTLGRVYYDKKIGLSEEKVSLKNSIDSCIQDAAEKSISETGIREESIQLYNGLVSTNIIGCTDSIFEEYKEQGYDVEKKQIVVESELNPETIILNVDFPIIVEKQSSRIELNEFIYSFDRSNSLSIPDGVCETDLRLISPNKKAELNIPEGVEIRDKDGNIVENIGIKVEDLHFDGLNNGVVMGELVYQNYPDGTLFSDKIEMMIEFDEEDIPEGYTKDNIRVSYWNEEDGIWYALPTQIKDNLAIANITHFSRYGLTIVTPSLLRIMMFRERFKPTAASVEPEQRGIWRIGSGEILEKDTASLQPGFFNDFTSVKSEYPDIAGLDYREVREMIESEFIVPNKIEYGYYTDPEDPDSEFIDCEEPGSNNPYGIEVFFEEDLPYFNNSIDDEKYFGWHNYQCAGGRVLPSEGEEFSEFIVYKPSGDAVIEILGMGIGNSEKPVIYPYVYPMKNTISVDYEGSYYKTYDDQKYPFYCEFIPFDDGEVYKKVNKEDAQELLSEDLLSEIEKLDISDNYISYGFKGLRAIKRQDHPLATNEMHVQCELFVAMIGDGVAFVNSPEKTPIDPQGLNNAHIYADISLDPTEGLVAEVLGAIGLKDTTTGRVIGFFIRKLKNIF